MPMRRAVRMTRQPISPRLAIRIFSNMGSHAEDTETGRLDGRVQGGGQRQAQDQARIGWVDHAVIPQTRTGIVRMSLRLVLGANGRFEFLFEIGRRRVGKEGRSRWWP